MITGKIILKSATKLTLDQRFGEIAKQAPPPPRVQQQTNVIIPQSRQELFGNQQRSATVNIANRLKKRSINYRLGLGNNAATNRQHTNPRTSHVFQRVSFGNGRRGGAANSYLFGGQSGMGIRLRGQGRIGTRIFRSQTRGYLNNNAISRFSGFLRRGNNNNNKGFSRRGNNNNNNGFARRGNNSNNYNNRGRRFGNRPNRGRGGNKNFVRGRGNGRNNNRGNNNNNVNFTRETLDNDLEKYMAQTKLDNDAVEMNAI